MRLKFWGTRGSLPKPGPKTLRYGGNTPCVQLVSDAGTLVILDCGTGAHALGQELLEEQPVRGHILVSHTHWDHIQGIPFFTPLFVPGNEFDIYGPRGFGQSLQESLAGQMQYTYFPVTLDALGADVRFNNLVEGSFQLDDIRVHTRYLNHTALTLGYRFDVDGVSVVYACDHEPHTRGVGLEEGDIIGQDREHAEFLRDADLVIHDAQFTLMEFAHKVGWGHSTAEYAVRLCRAVDVKRLAITHHDPTREDDELDRIVDALRGHSARVGSSLEIFAAAEGQVVELSADADRRVTRPKSEESALRVAPPSPASHTVLLGIGASPEAELISQAAVDDDLHVTRGEGVDEIVGLYADARPSLVVVDAEAEGLAMCLAIRQLDDDAREVPIIVLAPEPQDVDEVTDWLVPPFSREYARTRMRAWLIRTECRWVRPGLPENEEARLAALHALDILDTEAEERFDRLTRLAAAVLDVPISMVSLVDQDRQWFKSRVGLADTETSRDAAFCGHAILDAEPFVVPDALEDDRFADNPLVTGAPHVRFYAGCPVSSPDGHRVGTLCAIDTRPRELTERQLQLLRDLAAVVEAELRRSVHPATTE